jgi:hypothetical protein
MKKYQIRKQVSIGQQLIYCWDVEQKKWVKYEHYSSAVFLETPENARKITADLKADGRNFKYIRLYEVIG